LAGGDGVAGQAAGGGRMDSDAVFYRFKLNNPYTRLDPPAAVHIGPTDSDMAPWLAVLPNTWRLIAAVCLDGNADSMTAWTVA